MPGPTTIDHDFARVECDAEYPPGQLCGWSGGVTVCWDHDAGVWWWDCPRCGFSHESDGY